VGSSLKGLLLGLALDAVSHDETLIYLDNARMIATGPKPEKKTRKVSATPEKGNCWREADELITRQEHTIVSWMPIQQDTLMK
jgi:hypothetical protein